MVSYRRSLKTLSALALSLFLIPVAAHAQTRQTPVIRKSTTPLVVFGQSVALPKNGGLYIQAGLDPLSKCAFQLTSLRPDVYISSRADQALSFSRTSYGVSFPISREALELISNGISSEDMSNLAAILRNPSRYLFQSAHIKYGFYRTYDTAQALVPALMINADFSEIDSSGFKPVFAGFRLSPAEFQVTAQCS